MAECFLVQSGGSNPLAFKVVAYPTEEALTTAVPKGTVVGVVTKEKITSWIFSATEPESPMEGMVWFYTGAYSTAQFNALKKNGIQVYPISAKQYIGGAWAEKTAKNWKDGTWTDWWSGQLFDNGNQYAYITGGWVNKPAYQSNETKENAIIGDTLDLSTSGGKSMVVGTKHKIDVTDFRTLCWSTTRNWTGKLYLRTTDTGNVFDGNNAVETNSGSTDISSINGEFFVLIGANGGGYVTVTDVWLER